MIYILIFLFIVLITLVHYIMSDFKTTIDPKLSQEIIDSLTKEQANVIKERLSECPEFEDLVPSLGDVDLNTIPEEGPTFPDTESSMSLLNNASKALNIKPTTNDKKMSKSEKAKTKKDTKEKEHEESGELDLSAAFQVDSDTSLEMLLDVWRHLHKNSEFLAIYEAHRLSLSSSTIVMLTHRMCSYIRAKDTKKGDTFLAGYLQGALDVNVSQYKQLIDTTITNITNLVAGHAAALKNSNQLLATSSQNVNVLQQNVSTLIKQITTSKKEVEELTKLSKVKTVRTESAPLLVVPPSPVDEDPPSVTVKCSGGQVKITFSEEKNKIFMATKTKTLVSSKKGFLTALKEANYKGIVKYLNFDLYEIITANYPNDTVPADAFKRDD